MKSSNLNDKIPAAVYYKKGIATVYTDTGQSRFVSFNADAQGELAVAVGKDNDSIKRLGRIILDSDIAGDMTNVTGKSVVSAGAGHDFWHRLSDGRLVFYWDNNTSSLRAYVDDVYVGTVTITK